MDQYAKVIISGHHWQRLDYKWVKYKWYGPLDAILLISEDFIVLNGKQFVKQFPHGWGLRCIGFNWQQRAYMYKRYRF